METIDLAGTWSLSRIAGPYDEPTERRALPDAVPMRIPGDNYSALVDGGYLPDPYYQGQELDTLWAGRSDWRAGRSVTLSPEFCAARRAFLYIESLDTCAEVRINGAAVAESENMFAALRVEVGELLRAGENRIEILLRSAEKQALRMSERLPYPVPHAVYPVQSPHRNLVRKAQCHGGWDWGPCLMVSGVYGAIYLGSCAQGRIDYVATEATRQGSDWDLWIEIDYHAYGAARLPLEVRVAGTTVRRRVDLQPGANRLTATVAVRDPQLWWPAGYGPQRLYRLSVLVGDDRRELSIGFRTLELAAQEDGAGRGMVFVVNGREVYCKGANWVPADALPARQTRERVERLLSDAASANMNMVRVWGGGQYESEDFYRLCDEKGLLVWQDFMFSCATYPAEPWFLGRVSEEVRHQVKRLRHHPSLAIWCGNNENVGALGWFPESRENPLRYREDYERLNAVVRDIVRELDPGRPWWPSSPSAGPGDYTDNWHDDARGDMHYWSVWHEGRSFDAYYEVIPRFCSEFGFQSFPSLDAVRRFAPPDQWNVTSADMGHHQRSPRGNSVIIETMRRYFRRPEGFENLLYLSQVQQALAIRTAVEFWRSNRPRCMGSLYWQLNDVWPGASWSSIEHSGKWKLLHYAARRFFAAVHVAVHCADGETVRVVGLNDTSSRLPCRLVLRVIDFAGRTHLEEKAAVELEADASTQLRALPVQGLPLPPEAGFLQARLVPLQEPPAPESALPSGGAVPWGDAAPCSELFLVPYKRCELRQPKIDMQVDLEGEEPVVALRSDAPAFFVALEPGDVQGVFEDNLFTLLPGEPRTIRFSPRGELRGPSARERLRAGLKLFHLRATYP